MIGTQGASPLGGALDAAASVSRVYASLPLTWPGGWNGREFLRGAQLALERPAVPAVELVVLDCNGPHGDGHAVANARRAARDEAAVAYLGELRSPLVEATAPILGAAGLLQVTSFANEPTLEGPTLVRLTPHNNVGARAVAEWLAGAGVSEVLVVHERDDGYGPSLSIGCVQAARERGLVASSRLAWREDEHLADDLGDAQAVVYAGQSAESRAAALFNDLHAANPALWLLGRVAFVDPRLACKLDPLAAPRVRFFVPQRAALGCHGFDAMDFILASIAAGNGERAAVVRAARTTRERDSILGRYSIDEHGHTTGTAYGRRAIVGRELTWDLASAEPSDDLAVTEHELVTELEAFVAVLAETECYAPAAITGRGGEVVVRAKADCFSGAALLARSHGVLLECARGLADRESATPNRPETRFNVGSINKMFTAIAIAQLADNGRLDFSDTVSRHLPDYPRPVAEQVTIHQLLTHTSGLGDLFDPDGYKARQATLRTVSDYLELFADEPLGFEPGERFGYSNAGYVLLGAIIEQLSGQDYFEYVRAHIFAPAQMTDSGWGELDADEPNLATGYTLQDPDEVRPPVGPLRPNVWALPQRGGPFGLGFSTVGDLHRFGRAVLEHKLLSPALTKLVLAGKVDVNANLSYGYGFENRSDGIRSVGHGGGFVGASAEFTLFPELGYTLAVLSNCDPPAASRVAAYGRLLIAAAAFGLEDEPAAAAGNWNFETGDFTGWRTRSIGSGAWHVYSDGTRPPDPTHTDPNFPFRMPDPPEGDFAAVTDMRAAGTRILYRDLELDGRLELRFTLFYENHVAATAGFASPPTLDFRHCEPNLQLRTDLIDPAARLDSVDAKDILTTVFRTAPGDPGKLDPTVIRLDLSPWAGRTVRLRFAQVDNRGPMRTGVADVRLDAVGAIPAKTVPSSDRRMKQLERIVRERVDSGRTKGLVAGMVVADGSTRVVAYGDAGEGKRLNERSVFEIGSITKVFTGTLLAEMVQRGEVHLGDPVASLLPATVAVPSRGGRQITLEDLARQTSGLPPRPTNFHPEDPSNPYADYTVEQLYAFLDGYELTRVPGSRFEDTDVGVGLLGHALALRARTSYEELLRERILGPLQMTSTAITATAQMAGHFACGHDAGGSVVAHWDSPTLAGAGGLRSSITDLLRFAAASLDENGGPLQRAMATARSPRETIYAQTQIGLCWMTLSSHDREIVSHSGGTGGFCSFIGLDQAGHTAIVLLSNSGCTAGFEDIGLHLLDA